MKKIAIVHYMPLEFYPPVTNFLNQISLQKDFEIKVFSTSNNKKREEYSNKNLKGIIRTGFPNSGESGFGRMKKYLKFNLTCLLYLIKFKPSEIIYYESYSAGPVYWYLRLFGNMTKLKIHNHEYFSMEWYKNGMRLVKKYHTYEKEYLYDRADWISQTNSDRVNLFLKDNPNLDKKKLKVLPNYPPSSWNKYSEKEASGDKIIKTVYVGSLSLEATYIKEYCEWVIAQNGKVFFNIFAYNLHEDTKKYLRELNSDYIQFHNKGLEYKDIPFVLKEYNVGVILYKDYSENVRYCAPNKLFEYIVCGLEIWFSDKMKGCVPYMRSQYPRIMPVDFLNIEDAKLLKAETGIPTSISQKYTAEEALAPLINELAGR